MHGRKVEVDELDDETSLVRGKPCELRFCDIGGMLEMIRQWQWTRRRADRVLEAQEGR
jgi:hypothetical protein